MRKNNRKLTPYHNSQGISGSAAAFATMKLQATDTFYQSVTLICNL